MAVSFSAGDQLLYQYVKNPPTSALTSIGATAVKFRTSATTLNMTILSLRTSSSTEGYGIYLNGSSVGVFVQGYDVSSSKLALVSTPSINDGLDHVIVLNYNTNSGGGNQLWIDGVLANSANSSGDWSIGYTGQSPIQLGKSLDPFWGQFSGVISECAGWGRQLTSGEISAIQKGISMGRIARDAQRQSAVNGGSFSNPQACWHMPFNGDRGNRFNSVLTVTGTTLVPSRQVISPNFA